MSTMAKSEQLSERALNKTKLAYYGFTGLLSLLMMFSVGMYVFNHGEVQKVFGLLGFPSYLIYPLATAKILGILAIWSRKSVTLVNLAYAGFLYNFLLAFSAHIAIADGEFAGALLALVLLAGSYFTQKKLF